MRIFTELLFQHGHIADVALARQLAEPEIAMDVVTDASAEPAAQTAQSAPVAAEPAPRRNAEKRMARRARQLVRAMTALSPFR